MTRAQRTALEKLMQTSVLVLETYEQGSDVIVKLSPNITIKIDFQGATHPYTSRRGGDTR